MQDNSEKFFKSLCSAADCYIEEKEKLQGVVKRLTVRQVKLSGQMVTISRDMVERQDEALALAQAKHQEIVQISIDSVVNLYDCLKTSGISVIAVRDAYHADLVGGKYRFISQSTRRVYRLHLRLPYASAGDPGFEPYVDEPDEQPMAPIVLEPADDDWLAQIPEGTAPIAPAGDWPGTRDVWDITCAYSQRTCIFI